MRKLLAEPLYFLPCLHRRFFFKLPYILSKTVEIMAGGVAQAVERLVSNYEAPSSNARAARKTKQKTQNTVYSLVDLTADFKLFSSPVF
jgi:hypothetical protein